jgi:hypothetical protein
VISPIGADNQILLAIVCSVFIGVMNNRPRRERPSKHFFSDANMIELLNAVDLFRPVSSGEKACAIGTLVCYQRIAMFEISAVMNVA